MTERVNEKDEAASLPSLRGAGPALASEVGAAQLELEVG